MIWLLINCNNIVQALSSYVFIAANALLHWKELALQIKHLKELLPPILPLLTSHHHSLRGFTQFPPMVLLGYYGTRFLRVLSFISCFLSFWYFEASFVSN